MAEFIRVLQAAQEKVIRGAANETIENSIILKKLQERGKILYDQTGKTLGWNIKTSQHSLDGREDMETLQFNRQNFWTAATLPWRGYYAQDAISEKERLMVRGREALYQIWPDKSQMLKEDARDKMNIEMFVDGNATGYEKQLHGLESIFGAAASTTTSQYATCSETYAGLSPAAVHGTESATTPYSPHLVNEEYTGYGSWTTSPAEIARDLISACTVKNTRQGRPDLLLMKEDRYLIFKTALASEERYIIGSKAQDLSAGFQGLEYDGVEVLWDYDCTADCTYCLNLDQIEMRCLSKTLFYSKVKYSIEQDAHLFGLFFWGNMRINPRYQGKSKLFA